MSKRSNEVKTYNISVVGLSGLDKDQSLYGVGKSCLCNRFVRPLADDFVQNHTSVFSTSDFGGRVINNDSFLYWGTKLQAGEEGTEYRFNVVEQSEFIDDASLMPLARGVQPYPKRAASTKLSSPEKLMYISREQVALQNDFEQVPFPQGKFNIDGFLVVYDVESTNAKRLEETQERFVATLISQIQKTKRPFVIVANKCDDTQLNLLQELYRFIQSKKISAPIVECSALENVNVDLPFVVLAQVIEKGRARSKLIPYSEAHKTHQELMDKTLQDYQALVNRTVSGFSCLWKNVKKSIEEETVFSTYRDLYGSEACKKIFTKHIRKLRREFENRKLVEYMLKLPHALDELVPMISSLELYQWNWNICQKMIRNHKDFSSWFIVLPENTIWNESDHLLTDDTRIPYDVLSLPEAGQAFQLHIEKLKKAEKKNRMKSEFRKLLELTPQIRPGSEWREVYSILQNEESYQYLDDPERISIFDSYLRDIAERAKADFQELLFESASSFTKLEYNATPSEDDMKAIYASLCLDDRYRRLDKLESIRKIRILNHIALLNSPSRCLCGPDKCSDRQMQEIVATTAYRPEYSGSDETLDSEDSQLSIVVLGSEGLSQNLEKEIQSQCSYGEGLEYVLDGRMYELDLRVVDGDLDLPEYGLTAIDVTPHGYFCVYSTPSSLDYLRVVLEEMYSRSRYNSVDDTTLFNLSASITIFLAKSADNEDLESLSSMRQRGQDLAKRFGAAFIDIPLARFSRDKVIHETQVVDAMRIMVEDIKQQTRKLNSTDDIRDSEPDLKIMLCAMCGDPYPVELIFGPLLYHQSCWRSPSHPDTIVLETYVGFEKRRVQIKLTSYHRAYTLKDQMYHGYILVYSATRKASLATLSAFSASIPHVPIQVLAVTGSASGASVVFHSNDVPVTLLADGVNLASKLCAKFQTTSTKLQHQGGLFSPFFNSVWGKKSNSEMAYEIFIHDQRALRQNFTKRSVHDPLPAPPDKVQAKSDNEITSRRRTASEQLPSPPPLSQRLSGSYLDDTAPYAEFSADAKELIKAHSDNKLIGPMMSTPNVLSNHIPDEEKPSTPIIADRRSHSNNEAIYAVVNKEKKSLRKSKDLSHMNESEFNLIENSLYANPNLVPQRLSGDMSRNPPQLLSEDDFPENPPPLPVRLPNLEDDSNPNDSGVDTLRSMRNGYSTISDRRPIGNRQYEEIHHTPTTPSRGGHHIPTTPTKRGHANEVEDPYQMDFRMKVQMFDKNSRYQPPEHEVWVKRREQRNSVPDLSSKNKKAPLAQQEDDVEPEYSRIQDDSFAKESSVVNQMGSLRSAHSAEELGSSTIERRSYKPGFVKQHQKHKSQPLDGVTSDGGTGDEDSMSRKHDRERKKKLHIRISSKRRSSPARTQRKTSDKDTTNTSMENEKINIKKGKKSSKNEPQATFRVFVPVDSNEESSDTSSLENKKKNNLLKMNTSMPFGLIKGDSLGVPFRHDLNESEEETEEDLISPSASLSRNTTSFSKKKKSRREKELEKEKRREEKKRKNEIKQNKKINKKNNTFEKQKNRELMPSLYFGRRLEEICENEESCPTFASKCIDFVEEKGVLLVGIYRVAGRTAEARNIAEKFEENPNMDWSILNVSAHTVTGALKSFLKRLPEPLIPNNLQDAILEATVIMNAEERLSRLKDLINEMPSLHFVLLKRLMFHLNRVTSFSQENLMESRNLSTVIFPTLLRIQFESLQSMARQMNFGFFIQTCIEKCEYFFGEEEEQIVVKETQ